MLTYVERASPRMEPANAATANPNRPMANPITDKPAHTPEPRETAGDRSRRTLNEVMARNARRDECVNACKGIDDPAKFIQQMREVVEKAYREGWERKATQPDYLNYDIDDDWHYSDAREALSLLGAKDGREGL